MVENESAIIDAEVIEQFFEQIRDLVKREPGYCTDIYEVFTTDDLAIYYKVHYQTALKLFSKGEVLAGKIGAEYRTFKKHAIEYLENRIRIEQENRLRQQQG